MTSARELGAAYTLDYTATPAELAAAVREATGGVGVAVAYDGVGKATFDASLGSLRPRGMLALFGGASGQVPPFDLQRLQRPGSVFVTRPDPRALRRRPAQLLWRAGEVFQTLASGRVRMDIGGVYALEDAAAYEALEGRATTGKLIFQIWGPTRPRPPWPGRGIPPS